VASILKVSSSLVGVLVLVSGALALGQEREHGGPEPHPGPGMQHSPGHPPGEAHPGPQGYQRVGPPAGWDHRPPTVNKPTYQHNFQAARSFHIGPYHHPSGWAPHHWGYGQILPRAYWAPSYLIADYWLFALEVPPAGYEWVRDDTDALLVDVNTGEILQVEYGVFG
jgi:Ni/Co efflux regulator RcnB